MKPVSILDIVTNAMFKLGKFSPSEALPSEDAAYGLTELGGLIDSWNGDELYIFATNYLQLTLVPGVQPLTIGQGVTITSVSSDGAGNATFTGRNSFNQGDQVTTGNIGTIGGVLFDLVDSLVLSATPTQFVCATPTLTVVATTPAPVLAKAIYSTTDDQLPNYVTSGPRLVKVADANIILTGTNPIVKVPLRIRDKDWWISNNVPTVPTTLPTDLYYNPTYPNGSIYLWPLQTVSYGLELEVWLNLAEVTDLTYQFFMPQGYWRAVTLSLAEALLPTYGVPASRAGTIVAQARMARAIVKDMNSTIPRTMTADSGIPRGGLKNRSFFNYLSGAIVGPR
jgi:hypothetical protein